MQIMINMSARNIDRKMFKIFKPQKIAKKL